MPKKTFSIEEMSSDSYKSQYTNARNEPTIGGIKVSDANSREAKMLKMAHSLQQTGYMPNSSAGMSLDDRATAALGAIGVTSVTGKSSSKKSYSLLDSINNKTPLNPALMDASTAVAIENTKTSAHDKFTSVNDPFYVLDEKFSAARRAETDMVVKSTEATRGTEIAASFYDLNIANGTPTLKQFTK